MGSEMCIRDRLHTCPYLTFAARDHACLYRSDFIYPLNDIRSLYTVNSMLVCQFILAASVKMKPRQTLSRRDLHCCLVFRLGVSGSSRRGRFVRRDKNQALMPFLIFRGVWNPLHLEYEATKCLYYHTSDLIFLDKTQEGSMLS